MLYTVLAVVVLLFLARQTAGRGKTDLQTMLIAQNEFAGDIECVGPLLLRETKINIYLNGAGDVIMGTDKNYFLWIFGFVRRIPWQNKKNEIVPSEMADDELAASTSNIRKRRITIG